MFKHLRRSLEYPFVSSTISTKQLGKTRIILEAVRENSSSQSLLCCRMQRLTCSLQDSHQDKLSPVPPLEPSAYYTAPGISQSPKGSISNIYLYTIVIDLMGNLGFLGPPKIFHLFPQHWAWHCLSNHMKALPCCLQRALRDCSNYFPLMSHSIIIVGFLALQIMVLFKSQLTTSINQYSSTEVNSHSKQH